MINKVIAVYTLFCFVFSNICYSENNFMNLNEVNLVNPCINRLSTPKVNAYEEIELMVGSLKIKAPYLFTGEPVPYDGYVLKINDYKRLSTLLQDYNSGCDEVIIDVTEICKDQIDECYDGCEERVKKLHNNIDELKTKINLEIKLRKSETRKKYIYSTAGIVIGFSLGYFTTKIIK
tara:strand:- start:563 stop:1093 length:531 start_codon:yes stop_codon:yes gene_type:complete